MTARSLGVATALSASALFAAIAAPASADEVDDLFVALNLPEVLEIMREEGLVYGDDIANDMLEGEVGADWTASVAEIYDTERLRESVSAEFRSALGDADLGPMLAFFASEPGASIIDLEVSARKALLDEDVETAAREAATLAMADETDRYRLIERFAEANDLVETNVASALNANLAFYAGLRDGGALPAGLTDDQVLADVWGREGELRQSTTEWVMSFLMLAYQPLPDADIEAYIAFSETDPGAQLNRALFQAFEAPFNDVSRALGRLAAAELMRQDI